MIRAEKRSGTSTNGRAELRTILDFVRKGDVLTVTRIDRLARSIADLAAIVRELESKGAALKAIEQPIDTSTAAGRAFLQMLGVFAEFETAIRRERQIEGIEAAKTSGRLQRPAGDDQGRKPSPRSRRRDSAPARLRSASRSPVPVSTGLPALIRLREHCTGCGEAVAVFQLSIRPDLGRRRRFVQTRHVAEAQIEQSPPWLMSTRPRNLMKAASVANA